VKGALCSKFSVLIDFSERDIFFKLFLCFSNTDLTPIEVSRKTYNLGRNKNNNCFQCKVWQESEKL